MRTKNPVYRLNDDGWPTLSLSSQHFPLSVSGGEIEMSRLGGLVCLLCHDLGSSSFVSADPAPSSLCSPPEPQ